MTRVLQLPSQPAPILLLPASLLRVTQRQGLGFCHTSVDVVVLTRGPDSRSFPLLLRIARAFRARGRIVALRRVS